MARCLVDPGGEGMGTSPACAASRSAASRCSSSRSPPLSAAAPPSLASIAPSSTAMACAPYAMLNAAGSTMHKVIGRAAAIEFRVWLNTADTIMHTMILRSAADTSRGHRVHGYTPQPTRHARTYLHLRVLVGEHHLALGQLLQAHLQGSGGGGETHGGDQHIGAAVSPTCAHWGVGNPTCAACVVCGGYGGRECGVRCGRRTSLSVSADSACDRTTRTTVRSITQPGSHSRTVYSNAVCIVRV
jgi:hypothetical protein